MAEQFTLSVLFRVIDRAAAPMRRISQSLNRVGQRAAAAGRKFRDMGRAMSNAGKNLSLKMTLPLKLLGIWAARTAIKFESAFTGVKKTVKATPAQFAELEKKLEKLSLRLPTAAEGLYAIAEAGGQLGIQRRNLLGFTETMAGLAETTDIVGAEGAKALSRFANITKMSQKDFDKLGSVLVGLGNTMAASESEITNMSLRLAGAGDLVGLTQAQIVGMAAALADVGINAEAGGTAFSQVMRKIDKAIGTSSKEMKGFAWVLGVTVGDLKKRWKKDAAGVIINFVEKLRGVEKRGINVNAVLDALGMEGIRISDALLRASGAGDKFRESMKAGTKLWKDNNALAEELSKRLGTTESKLRMFWNNVRLTAKYLGKDLLPSLVKVVKWFSPFVSKMKELSPTTKKIIFVIAALAAAVGPLLFIFSQITIAIAGLAIALPVISGAILPVTLAIIGLGLAAHYVIKHWGKIKPFMKGLLSWIRKEWDKLVENIRTAVDKILDKIPDFLKRKLGIAVPAPELKPQYRPRTDVEKAFEKELSRHKDLISMAPSGRIDLSIRVAAEEGSSAVIAGVKSTGDIDPSIISETYVGPSLGGIG